MIGFEVQYEIGDIVEYVKQTMLFILPHHCGLTSHAIIIVIDTVNANNVKAPIK